MLTLKPYEPEGIKPFVFHGSTSNIGRLKEHPNAVLKYYKEAWWDLSKLMNDARRSLYRSRFQVEETILPTRSLLPRAPPALAVTERAGKGFGASLGGSCKMSASPIKASRLIPRLLPSMCLAVVNDVFQGSEISHVDIVPISRRYSYHPSPSSQSRITTSSSNRSMKILLPP